MSLLIKALQKAEQGKGNASAEKSAAGDGVTLELTPHHDDIDPDFSLADEGGFHEPRPTKTPAHEAKPVPLAEHRSEREAAASVFRAHTDATTDPRGRRALWFGLGGLAFLLLLGIGFYFYLDTLQQPELVVARPPHPQPITPAAAIPPGPAPVAAAQTASAEPAGLAPPTPVTNIAEPVAAKPAEAAAPVVEKPLVTTTPTATRKMQKMADTENSAVEVKRNRTSEPAIDATSMAAYQAYTTGDDVTAGRLYRQLLQSDPRSTDALLGLAAVATRKGNNDEATGYYARTLDLEPKNSVAQAGLIALLGQADPVSAESRLKSLLAQQPDAAYLHAALGGLYAEQNQWSNAQQAYFQAFHLDPGNAEHAFNLAVSLDQMGKPDLALDYYQHAHDLLPKQGGPIDRNGLETRISQLRSALGK